MVRKKGRTRKGILSNLFFSPIRQEVGGFIRATVRRKTKSAIKRLAGPRGTLGIPVKEALEFDRKRFRIRRR